jgi:hypothetical protein
MTTTITAAVTTSAMNGPATSVGLLTTLLLVALLIGKEIAAAAPERYRIKWGRPLTIGMAPLLIAVAFNIALRLLAVW